METFSDKDIEAPGDFWEDSESVSYTVIRPDTNTTCESISCVTSSGWRTAVCLDMRLVNMSAGDLSGVRRVEQDSTPSKGRVHLILSYCNLVG